MCLVDATGRNPNVNYELGLAHGLNKPAIIITQAITDVPFDYRHLRLIQYNPRSIGWESLLKTAITKTINEVRTSPTSNMAFDNVPTDEDKMRKHLIAQFFEVECELYKVDDMFCEENGNTLIKTQWDVKADGPIYQLCHNLKAELTGTIEIRKAYDRLNGRDLETITIDRGDRHLSYFFLLHNFMSKGDRFLIETEVFVEHYMEGLSKQGMTLMSNQAASKSKIRFKNKTERYHLPKIAKFQNAYAEIVNHPRSEMIGTRINCIKTSDEYLIEVVYDSEASYRSTTAVKIHL